MNHLDQFKRSINIWKLSDYEKIDIYVEIYLYMEEVFKDLKIFKPIDRTHNKLLYYGKDINNIYLLDNKYLDYIAIYKKGIYKKFDTISNDNMLKLYHYYFTTYLNIQAEKTLISFRDIKTIDNLIEVSI